MENVKCKSGSAVDKVKKIRKVFSVIGILILVLLFCFLWGSKFNQACDYHEEYHQSIHNSIKSTYCTDSKFACGFDETAGLFFGSVAFCVAIGFLEKIFLWAFCSSEICVTDQRVYGKANFGKNVDLPLDSISAVAVKSLQTVVVSTTGGAFSFSYLNDAEKVYRTVSELLRERKK